MRVQHSLKLTEKGSVDPREIWMCASAVQSLATLPVDPRNAQHTHRAHR